MRECPVCQHWTLEYDEYFGRYRCFNPDCEWMPASSTEREIKLLETRNQPTLLCIKHISTSNLATSITCDPVNDVLGFRFGSAKLAIDLPEPDGRLIWKIDPETHSVVGFEILEAKKLGVSHVQIDIESRKRDIEQDLKRLSQPFFYGRPTGPLVARIAVTAKTNGPNVPTPLLRDALEQFGREYCH